MPIQIGGVPGLPPEEPARARRPLNRFFALPKSADVLIGPGGVFLTSLVFTG